MAATGVLPGSRAVRPDRSLTGGDGRRNRKEHRAHRRLVRSGFVTESDGPWVLTLPCPRVLEVNSLSSHVGPRGDTLQTDAGTAEGDKVPEPRGSICFIGHT